MRTLLALFFSFHASYGFAQCGVYALRGVFHLKSPIKASYYELHGESKSQERYSFNSIFDLNRLGSAKGIPSEIIVEMVKPMDATRGEIERVTKISPSYDHPLKTGTDKNKVKIKDLNCKK